MGEGGVYFFYSLRDPVFWADVVWSVKIGISCYKYTSVMDVVEFSCVCNVSFHGVFVWLKLTRKCIK
jgi:hypothetical protein